MQNWGGEKESALVCSFPNILTNNMMHFAKLRTHLHDLSGRLRFFPERGACPPACLLLVRNPISNQISSSSSEAGSGSSLWLNAWRWTFRLFAFKQQTMRITDVLNVLQSTGTPKKTAAERWQGSLGGIQNDTSLVVMLVFFDWLTHLELCNHSAGSL